MQPVSYTHLDVYKRQAFYCRASDQSTLEEEQSARRKSIRYWRDQGLDLTSEHIFSSTIDASQDTKDGNSVMPAGLVGLMPYAWHLIQDDEFWFSRPASLLAGGGMPYNDSNAASFTKDYIAFLYGRNMQAEGFLTQSGVKGAVSGWEDIFTSQFSLNTLIYVYLNQYKNESIIGDEVLRTLVKEGNLVSEYSEITGEGKISSDGMIIRENNDVFVPVVWEKDYLQVNA